MSVLCPNHNAANAQYGYYGGLCIWCYAAAQGDYIRSLGDAYQELVEDMPINRRDFPKTFRHMLTYERGRFDMQPFGVPRT